MIYIIIQNGENAMDNFAEQLVKKNETQADKTRRISLLIVGILLTAAIAALAVLQLGNFLVSILGFALAVACGYGTYAIYRNSFVEYEYTFTNGELDVDKIINQSKRTEMIVVEVREFTDFGRYDENMKETEEMTVISASDSISKHEFYADFDHAEYGTTRLIFAPDDRMMENIRKFLPAKLRSKQIL